MAADQPGKLIGTGRDADVFDLGDARVLRRNRDGRDCSVEAGVMQHLFSHGYPVPEVFDVDGGDLVMALVEGPTMLDDMGNRPWTLPSSARTLTSLIKRLGEVPLPDVCPKIALAAEDEATVLMHGDLHPDNVLMGSDGPVVIDWPNVRLGPPGGDTAQTWLLGAAGDPGGSLIDRITVAIGRKFFLGRFLDASDTAVAARWLMPVYEDRRNDPNQSTAELESMLAVATEHGTP